MKPSKIADKIITDMYRDFLKTGNVLSNAEKFVNQFSDIYPQLVYAAIRILGAEGLLNVSYSDNNPDELELSIDAIQKFDDETLIKKGYSLLKELRSWR